MIGAQTAERSGSGGAALTPAGFARETGVPRETLARFETYLQLLAKWNRAINLVGAGTLDDAWRRHMLDCAQLLPLLPPCPPGETRRIVDLGSGAGFPGLVLALLEAGEVHLVESDQRKAQFLREAARTLDLDVAIHRARIEALDPLPVDVVTARACAPLAKLLEYAERFPARLKGGPLTCLFLKGRQAEDELTAIGNAWNMRVERFPSRTDPTGTILRIGLINRDKR